MSRRSLLTMFALIVTVPLALNAVVRREQTAQERPPALRGATDDPRFVFRTGIDPNVDA